MRICSLGFSVLLAANFMVLNHTTATAAVGGKECKQIRKLNSEHKGVLYFEDTRGFSPVQSKDTHFSNFVKSNNNGSIRFIYFVAPYGDARSTLFDVKQRFVTDHPFAGVRTYNNIRQRTLNVSFDDYQAFHKNDDNSVAESRSLMEWFHLRPGLFRHRDFVDTSAWKDPRQFFAFSSPRMNDEELRSYLIALRGVRPDGSCFDFEPYVSPSTHEMSFSIQNLRPTSTGDYRDPLDLEVEIVR